MARPSCLTAKALLGILTIACALAAAPRPAHAAPGMELALMDDAEPSPMPPWFHFGYRLQSPDAVLELHRRMSESGVILRKPLYRDDSLVSFRCADPDGYAIEIYWEAPGAPLD